MSVRARSSLRRPALPRRPPPPRARRSRSRRTGQASACGSPDCRVSTVPPFIEVRISTSEATPFRLTMQQPGAVRTGALEDVQPVPRAAGRAAGRVDVARRAEADRHLPGTVARARRRQATVQREPEGPLVQPLKSRRLTNATISGGPARSRRLCPRTSRARVSRRARTTQTTVSTTRGSCARRRRAPLSACGAGVAALGVDHALLE